MWAEEAAHWDIKGRAWYLRHWTSPAKCWVLEINKETSVKLENVQPLLGLDFNKMFKGTFLMQPYNLNYNCSCNCSSSRVIFFFPPISSALAFSTRSKLPTKQTFKSKTTAMTCDLITGFGDYSIFISLCSQDQAEQQPRKHAGVPHQRTAPKSALM